MAVKKDILDALWTKNEFWSKELSRAQDFLTLVQNAHVESSKRLEGAKHTVECCRSTRVQILAAINTIEDLIND